MWLKKGQFQSPPLLFFSKFITLSWAPFGHVTGLKHIKIQFESSYFVGQPRHETRSLRPGLGASSPGASVYLELQVIIDSPSRHTLCTGSTFNLLSEKPTCFAPSERDIDFSINGNDWCPSVARNPLLRPQPRKDLQTPRWSCDDGGGKAEQIPGKGSTRQPAP